MTPNPPKQCTDLRQMWATPDDFFSACENSLGRFDLDACAMPFNKKCADYISPDGNAFENSWVDDDCLRVWCNPGFNDLGAWCEKALHEARWNPRALVAVLGIPSFSAQWWEDYATKASEIRFICGKRIQFVPHPALKKSSNARENCLIIFRGDHDPRIGPRMINWYWQDDVKGVE